MFTEKPVLCSEESFGGGPRPTTIGVIELNRPQVLNALNLEMYQIILSKLKSWEQREDVVCIVFRGRGDRAFCSGGDVKALVSGLIENNDMSYAKEFFLQEYFVDYYVQTFSKPILAWCDGLVMGGGLGLVNGASHKVVTPKTVMSMPEISIGFFPDVGSTYYLSLLRKSFGVYLGMTGTRFSAVEALSWGLADFYLSEKSFRYVMADILRAPWSMNSQKNKEVLSEVLKLHESKFGERAKPLKSSYFDCEDKWASLWESSSSYNEFESHFLSQAESFPPEDMERFQKGAPFSKLLIWEIFKNRPPESIKEALVTEWVLAINSCKNKFFREGVRALLIDKKGSPDWALIKELNKEDVQSFFDLESGETNELKEMIESFDASKG